MKLDSVDSGGLVAGCCENGHEHACSVNGEEFIEQLCDDQLLKNCVPYC